MTVSAKRAHVVRLLCGTAATLLIAAPAFAADPIVASDEPAVAAADPQAGEDVVVKGHRQAVVDADRKSVV